MYRFGIVGAGMIADFHALAINAIPNADLTAIYSRSIDKAKAFSQKHNCTPFDDYAAFINSPNIDIVTDHPPPNTTIVVNITPLCSVQPHN